jgi:hypothetical protein
MIISTSQQSAPFAGGSNGNIIVNMVFFQEYDIDTELHGVKTAIFERFCRKNIFASVEHKLRAGNPFKHVVNVVLNGIGEALSIAEKDLMGFCEKNQFVLRRLASGSCETNESQLMTVILPTNDDARREKSSGFLTEQKAQVAPSDSGIFLSGAKTLVGTACKAGNYLSRVSSFEAIGNLAGNLSGSGVVQPAINAGIAIGQSFFPSLCVITATGNFQIARGYNFAMPLKPWIESNIKLDSDDYLFSICKTHQDQLVELGSHEDLTGSDTIYAFSTYKVAFFHEMVCSHNFVPKTRRCQSAPPISGISGREICHEELTCASQMELQLQKEKTKQAEHEKEKAAHEKEKAAHEERRAAHEERRAAHEKEKAAHEERRAAHEKEKEITEQLKLKIQLFQLLQKE